MAAFAIGSGHRSGQPGKTMGGIGAQPDPGAHPSGPRRRPGARAASEVVRQNSPTTTLRHAKAMLANPDIGVTQIAHRLGVSPATLYRYIPAARTANSPGV